MTTSPLPGPCAAVPDTPGPAERTGWLVPTAVLGGLGALLLLGGGGAAMAASLSVQQHRVATTVAEPVDTVVVDGHSAAVEVVTADVPDLRVDAVHTGIGLDRAPEPRVQDGRLTIGTAPSGGWPWAGGGMQVTVTVPADDGPVDLRLTTDAGTLSTDGDFGDVSLTTDAGVVEVSGSARSLSAVSEVGTVVVSGARVAEDLDVHTKVGATEVRVAGEAPRRTSVTTRTGSVEAVLPNARYWTPSVAGEADRDPGQLTAATVCAGAPQDRPCLHVSAAMGSEDVRYAGAAQEDPGAAGHEG